MQAKTGGNSTDKDVSNSLTIIQNALASASGNTSQTSIPSRLVLTPETDPLRPPGYGYPVLPGLKRLRPQPKNSTKPKKPTGLSPADQEMRISKYAMYYCYLALATFICSYGQMLCWSISELSCFKVKQYERLRQEDDLSDDKDSGGKDDTSSDKE